MALISWAFTLQLICTIVFAYTKSRFSHEEHRRSRPVFKLHTKQAVQPQKIANLEIYGMETEDSKRLEI